MERAQWVNEKRNRQLQRQEDELKQKINKPNESVKRILQQFDNGPMPSDVVPDIEDVTLEVENLALNKDIGVQTDEFSYVFSQVLSKTDHLMKSFFTMKMTKCDFIQDCIHFKF